MLNYVLLRSHVLPKSIPWIKTSRLLFSTSSHLTQNKVPVKLDNPRPNPRIDPDYKIIYRYPGIDLVRAMSRMKIYCAVTSAIMIPTCFILELNEKVEADSTLLVTYLNITMGLSFCIAGILMNKFIGIVMYNSKTDIVKIASLSYFGKRVDDYVQRSHLTPFKTLKYFPMLSTTKDKKTNKEYKILALIGIRDPLVYNSIFYPDPKSLDSNLSTQSKLSQPPPDEKDVDFEELAKKIRQENEKRES